MIDKEKPTPHFGEVAEEIKRLRALLQRWCRTGCPDCGGDCGSANPPVPCCIVQETRAALAVEPAEGREPEMYCCPCGPGTDPCPVNGRPACATPAPGGAVPDCSPCAGTGSADFAGFAMDRCGECGGSGVDPLADLVARFATALLEKLRAAEAKYGYQHAWRRPDWQGDLHSEVMRHIAKGDPRDVAAYCAFAWHHGWSLAPTPPPAPDAAP